jgi:hypothetical protein
MDTNKFDALFSKKVKEVLPSWEVPYEPENWEKLLEKKEEKRRRGIIPIYWYGAAAVVIIGASLFGLWNNTSNETNNISPVLVNETIDSINTQDIHLKEKIQFKDVINDNNSRLVNTADKPTVNRKNNSENPSVLPNSVFDVATVNHQSRTIFNAIALHEKGVSIKNPKLVVAELDMVEKPEVKNHINDIELALAMNDETNKIDKDEKVSKFLFGLNTAPLVSYSPNSDKSNLGYEIGATSEFQVTDNLSIQSGISLVSQNIIAEKNDVASINTSGSFLKSEEVLLKSVDIPLNVKYGFELNGKNAFVSLGVSSSSYFKQEVERTIQDNAIVAREGIDPNGAVSIVEAIESSNRLELESSSSGFNFANTLNISFGVELPFKNFKDKLFIEPYIKQPLKTVNRANFTSGGMRILYLFGNNK